MLSVEVKKFGPILDGRVTLQPLTIFVGPNNAGKSYLSMLLYSIFRSFSTLSQPFGFMWLQFQFPETIRKLQAQERKEIQVWLQDILNRGKSQFSFNDLPKSLQEKTHDFVTKFIFEDVARSLTSEVQRCFASEITDLIKKEDRKTAFSLSLEQTTPPLNMLLKLDDSQLAIDKCDYSLLNAQLEIDRRLLQGEGIDPERAILWLLWQVISKLLHSMTITPYYFPAARSGILQSHKALASIVVSRNPLVGIEPFNIPTLSGVVADFISTLLALGEQKRYRGGPSITQIAKFLESEVSHGKIDLKAPETRFEYPEIYYEFKGKQFPLHRTSSMVSEIAPIVLFLKYVVAEGNLLIIEEPEAHLHPDSQRVLARAIVKLIRQGVHVLITTHSDYFVEQLSNFILLERMPEERRKLGYSEEDYLSAQEVGAYLFEFRRKATGSSVKELEINSKDGIPQDEFTRIAEALYQETTRLQRIRFKH